MKKQGKDDKREEVFFCTIAVKKIWFWIKCGFVNFVIFDDVQLPMARKTKRKKQLIWWFDVTTE